MSATAYGRANRSLFILVMLLLHYLPRLNRHGVTINSDFKRVAGRTPISLDTFIAQNRPLFEQIGI